MKEQQEKYNLPEGWVLATINELIDARTGLFKDGDWIETKDQNPKGEVRLIQLADVGDSVFRNRSDRFMNKDTAIRLNCTFLKQGDILVARMPEPIGRACIFPFEENEKYVTVVDVAVIRVGKNGINNKLLMYFINSPIIRKQIEEFQTGTTRKRISRGNLSKFLIPIPPLNEQNRIVLKLEEILSSLEKSKEQLEIALKQLSFYKQSILKKAYEGNLTKLWRSENFDNDSINILPAGWYYIELSKTVNHKPKRIKPSGESDLKFIGLDSIEPNTLYPSVIHNFSDYKSSAIYFTRDQVLYGRMRPYLNKVWKADFEGACSGEFLVLGCTDIILSDYLKYKLHSMDFVDFASERSTGDRPRVSFDKISDYQIPLCSIDEQAEIVRIIEHHFSNADKISSWVIDSLEKLKVLEKIILKQAVEGKLLEQDPNDEPARILLERIKIEKEEFLVSEKEKKSNLIKIKIMPKELKSILEILKEIKEPISSKQLWLSSDKKDDIEEFYAELKKYIESGDIIELPRNGKESFLKLADKS